MRCLKCLRQWVFQQMEQLVEETVPAGIRTEEMTDLPEAISEFEFLRHIQELADQNEMFRTYIGQGYHGTILPGPIQRNILENPGWYTAYTPYQAEIAQGRMEALLNYQTMSANLPLPHFLFVTIISST